MVNAYAKPEAFNKMLAGKAGLQLDMLHVKSLKLKIPWFNWSAGQLLTPTLTLTLTLTLTVTVTVTVTVTLIPNPNTKGVDIELDSLLVVVRPLDSDHWSLEEVRELKKP
jgi:hypothetical protein